MDAEQHTVKVSNSNHKEKLLLELNEYRQRKYLCDITIVVQGHEFPAHKAVLAAAGGYFSGLFAAKMREKADIHNHHNIVHLNEVDPSVMDDVLTFIYYGEIELNRENAQPFLMAADFLSLTSLDNCKDTIGEFLAKIIEATPPDTKDLLFILQFADHYNCKRLQEVAVRLVQSNFETVLSKSKEIFLNLPADIIEDIISSDELVISNEQVVFEAVVEWTKYKDERRDPFHRLFQKVRLCSFTEEFLHQTVLRETLVASNPYCVNLVLGTLKSKYNPATPDGPRPRSCLDTYTDAIIVFTTEELNYDHRQWCYTPSNNTWCELPTDDGYGYGEAVYYDGSVYFVKKCSSGLVLDRYEIETSTWAEVAVLSSENSEDEDIATTHKVACLNGIIYIVGGDKSIAVNRFESIPDVQSCDVRGTQNGSPPLITNVAPMKTFRSCAAIVTDNNYIYVMGGLVHTLDDVTVTNTVERYDPRADSWTYLAPMKHKGCHGRCTIAGDKIFLSLNLEHNDEGLFQIYEICNDIWFQVPTAPRKYGSSNLVSFSGQVSSICISSYDDDDGEDFQTTSYLTYDFNRNSWLVKSYVSLQAAFTETDSTYFSAIAVRLPKRKVESLSRMEFIDIYSSPTMW